MATFQDLATTKHYVQGSVVALPPLFSNNGDGCPNSAALFRGGSVDRGAAIALEFEIDSATFDRDYQVSIIQGTGQVTVTLGESVPAGSYVARIIATATGDRQHNNGIVVVARWTMDVRIATLAPFVAPTTIPVITTRPAPAQTSSSPTEPSADPADGGGDIAGSSGVSDEDEGGMSGIQTIAIIVGGTVTCLIIALTLIRVKRSRDQRQKTQHRSMVAHTNPVYIHTDGGKIFSGEATYRQPANGNAFDGFGVPENRRPSAQLDNDWREDEMAC